jgi:hypothetical protein
MMWQVKISNRFAALKNFEDDNVDIHRAGEKYYREYESFSHREFMLS